VEDSVARLVDNELLLIDAGVDENCSVSLAVSRRSVEGSLDSVVGSDTIHRCLGEDERTSRRKVDLPPTVMLAGVGTTTEGWGVTIKFQYVMSIHSVESITEESE
jgi:hypothetical protein